MAHCLLHPPSVAVRRRNTGTALTYWQSHADIQSQRSEGFRGPRKSDRASGCYSRVPSKRRTGLTSKEGAGEHDPAMTLCVIGERERGGGIKVRTLYSFRYCSQYNDQWSLQDARFMWLQWMNEWMREEAGLKSLSSTKISRLPFVDSTRLPHRSYWSVLLEYGVRSRKQVVPAYLTMLCLQIFCVTKCSDMWVVSITPLSRLPASPSDSSIVFTSPHQTELTSMHSNRSKSRSSGCSFGRREPYDWISMASSRLEMPAQHSLLADRKRFPRVKSSSDLPS